MASEHECQPLSLQQLSKQSEVEDSGEVGSQKVARLKELRSRLYPVRASSSRPVSHVVDLLSGAHVAGSSPSLSAIASHACDFFLCFSFGSESVNPFEAAIEPPSPFVPSPRQASSDLLSLPLPRLFFSLW